jgi:hypothetical protein
MRWGYRRWDQVAVADLRTSRGLKWYRAIAEATARVLELTRNMYRVCRILSKSKQTGSRGWAL